MLFVYDFRFSNHYFYIISSRSGLTTFTSIYFAIHFFYIFLDFFLKKEIYLSISPLKKCCSYRTLGTTHFDSLNILHSSIKDFPFQHRAKANPFSMQVFFEFSSSYYKLACSLWTTQSIQSLIYYILVYYDYDTYRTGRMISKKKF